MDSRICTCNSTHSTHSTQSCAGRAEHLAFSFVVQLTPASIRSPLVMWRACHGHDVYVLDVRHQCAWRRDAARGCVRTLGPGPRWRCVCGFGSICLSVLCLPPNRDELPCNTCTRKQLPTHPGCTGCAYFTLITKNVYAKLLYFLSLTLCSLGHMRYAISCYPPTPIEPRRVVRAPRQGPGSWCVRVCWL